MTDLFFSRSTAIRFVNGVNKITCAILGLMKHDPIRGLEGKESLMPVGLIWDPRSRGIFFNGQAGHLQLFDLEHSSVVFNVTQIVPASRQRPSF